MNDRTRVIVLGGGFAGLQAVKTLVKKAPNAELTLIDANAYATMLPALPDVLSGRVPRWALTRSFTDILPKGVRLLQDTITAMDFGARLLTGLHGTYRYDYLVVANGSRPAFFGFTPSSGTLHTLHSYTAAESLRAELLRSSRETDHTTLVVVGGGYTGLEVATFAHHGFADLRPGLSILVVERADSILSFVPEKGRRKVLAYLQSIEVELKTGVSLEELNSTVAKLSDGTTVHNPVVCWTAGMQGANDTIAGSVDQTRDKRLQTNEYLQLPVHPEVFVAGDAAALGKGHAAALSNGDAVLRRALIFAYDSGRLAADNCVRVMQGRELRAFHPVDPGWVIPLGGMSLGKLFGFLPVGGRWGLRLHYFLAGIRHFGAAQAWEFMKTALFLGRAPDKPDRTRPPSGPLA